VPVCVQSIEDRKENGCAIKSGCQKYHDNLDVDGCDDWNRYEIEYVKF
jgi:hypothetical protein